MKKLISFALLGAFLAVGCGDDKAKKPETTKKAEGGPVDKGTKAPDAK